MGQESQLRRLGGRKPNKSPPIMSHEFMIQNHADITSCVAMLFVVALMFHVTAPLGQIFVTMQYNITTEQPDGAPTQWRYGYGPRDVATVFFYTLIAIVIHAVLQEYGVDKLSRRVHLSKTKTAKFSESGQLAIFYLVSAGWAGYLVATENYISDITMLWKDYPTAHRLLSFPVKCFFIGQIAYWIHCYPELYFQKAKRDEMKSRTIYATLYLICIVAAYVFNFNRVCICILALHYAAEFIYHVARLTHFTENSSIAAALWKIWNGSFILVRLGCVTLAVLTFWYGLRISETTIVEPIAGNFNTQFIRLNCLMAVFLLQGWLMWNFICAWLRRARDTNRAAGAAGQKSKTNANRHQKKNKAKKFEEEVNSLPESDQYELRQRQTASS